MQATPEKRGLSESAEASGSAPGLEQQLGDLLIADQEPVQDAMQNLSVAPDATPASSSEVTFSAQFSGLSCTRQCLPQLCFLKQRTWKRVSSSLCTRQCLAADKVQHVPGSSSRSACGGGGLVTLAP
jgi:hypothetical protein